MKEWIYMTDPYDYDDPPAGSLVERKVTAATFATLAFSMLTALLIAIQNDPTILLGLPPWLQFVLIAVLPPIATFVAGYGTPSNRVG
jgi:hypothetical protein